MANRLIYETYVNVVLIRDLAGEYVYVIYRVAMGRIDLSIVLAIE